MTSYHVKDNGDPRRYFTMIPNIIDDLDLSPYAFRLYVHLKRVAGDEGTCYQNRDTLAEKCHMSAGSVTEAKNELVALGLIEIEDQPTTHGGKPYHIITITDVWDKNHSNYSPMSPDDLAMSPGDIKNNPIKNNNESNAKNAFDSKSTPPLAFVDEIQQTERIVMDAYSRKRRLNKPQREIVNRIGQSFSEETIREWLAWAVVSEIPLGKALTGAEKTLAKWGKPKPMISKGGKGSKILDPGSTPTPEYPDNVLDNDPLYQQLFGGKNANTKSPLG
jgi:hypothetical protein